MVFISSSYVFDGNKGSYKEDDPVLPTNQYAITKIMAEKEVSKLSRFLIIRVEMMYGLDQKRLDLGQGDLIKKLLK